MEKPEINSDRTAFVGRVDEIKTATQWLAGTGRLLTLTGPPGIGKTRLAQKLVENVAGHEVLFIELASARTARELADRVAHTLEVELHTETRSVEVADSVGHALTQRSVLVVLDNFEQLALQARHTLAQWVETATSVKFVVTSREPLRLSGERVLELAALGLPPAGNEARGVLVDSEAGELFLARADLRLGKSEVRLITEIVRRLEGIPLAIELAATQLRVLGPLQLLRRLENRIDIASHRLGTDSRHTTLRAAVGWSWELLDDTERSVLMQLAIFRGGFSAEAAEAIVDTASHHGVTTVLANLVDKSLVRSRSLLEPAGLVVLSLYAAIRDYVLSLDGQADAIAAASERHLHYYHRRSKEIASTPLRRYAVEELAPELDNLVASVEHALAAPPSKQTLEAALEILIAMEPIVLSAAPLTAYPTLIEQTIARAKEVGAKRTLIARIHLARATVLQQSGRLSDARDDVVAARELAGASPSDSLRAELALRHGATHRYAQEEEVAESYFNEALAAAQKAGDKRFEAEAVLELARLDGERDRARECLEGCKRALALAREVGDAVLEANARTAFLFLYALTGRTTDARREYIRFVRVDRRARLPRSQATVARINVAIACHEAGRFGQARAHFERAVSAAKELGARRLEGGALDNFGALLLEQGDLDAAFRACERALALNTQAGARRHTVATLAHLGTIEALRDRLPEATARFRDAGEVLNSLESKPLDVALEVFAGHIDLARVRAAMRSGDHRLASEARTAAFDKLKLVRANRERLDRQEELRFASRLLQAACQSSHFVIADDGEFFVPPGQPKVSLGNRPTLRRMLAGLVASFLGCEGQSMGLDELIACGWPGEQMQAESAKTVSTSRSPPFASLGCVERW